MTEKFKNCLSTAELLINYSQELIDLATELQYLLIEEQGVREDKKGNSSKEMPVLRLCRCNEERTQEIKGEMGASVEVQKMYLPVFKLSAKNTCTNPRD